MLNQCVQHSYQKVDRHTEKYKHFSFVIQGNEILSVGANKRIDHACIYPRSTYHAEFVALQRARRRLNKRQPWYMINVRIGKDGLLRNSRPCSICQTLLSSADCNKVIYTIDQHTEGVLRL